MRKVLSFVLVLSLVLGSFSMAFAATPAGLSDIDGIANEEAIQVAYDLEIVTGNPDGTFLPTKAVTRAEFAAMITRALAIPDSALAGYTATTFKDTAGYGWAVPYLAFCQSKGIMLGDGMGNAMPGRTINTNEAVTMALRAIGYTANSAELVGAWPSNYVTLAQNAGLYDDVAKVVSVDKANAAQIIYNLLTVQKVAVNSDGDTNPLWVGKASDEIEATLLNTGLGATAWADAAVVTGEEDSSINLRPYVGALVVAYEKDDEIIAIGDVKSTFLTGEYDEAEGILDVDGTDYKLASTKALGVDEEILGVEFANGAADAQADIDNPEDMADLAYDGDTITVAVDLSGKTVNELYSVAAWTVDEEAVVDAADLEGIDDEELLGVDFVLDDDDAIDLNSFELVGVNSLADIKADNVVYVYAYGAGHDDEDSIAKIAVGTTVVEGKITDFDDDAWTIGGKEYEKATGVTGDYADLTENVGDTFKFFLDVNGNIYKAEEVDSTPNTYALINWYEESGINGGQIKLYTSEDATKTFPVDNDYDITAGAIAADGGDDGILIGYGLNKDGEIDSLDLNSSTAGGVTFTSAKVMRTTTIDGVASAQSIAVSKNVVVFTTDEEVISIGKVPTGEVLTGAVQYIYNADDDEIVAIVVDPEDADANADDTYAVFNKITKTYDADQDETVTKLVGFADGTALSKNANDVLAAASVSVGAFLVEFDADGYVNEVTYLTTGAVEATVGLDDATTIAALKDSKTVVESSFDGELYEIADDAVVYELVLDDGDIDEYKVASNSSLREGYSIIMYDTDEDVDGYELVIFCKEAFPGI